MAFYTSASRSPSDPLQVDAAGKISWNNDITATDPVKTLFSQMAGLTPVAGTYLQTSLGLVQEIFALVQEVKDKDNWDEYICIARKAMQALHDIAVSEKEQGHPIGPGTDAAVLAEGINKGLKNLQDQLQEYTQLLLLMRLIERNQHKKNVTKVSREIDSALSKFEFKGDVEKHLLHNRATSGSTVAGDLSRPDALSATNVREDLQKVSSSISQGSQPATSRQQCPLTANEAKVFIELNRQMRRKYSRGESEDLTGVYDNNSNEMLDSKDDSSDDAQAALNLLNELCKPQGSFDDKKALGQMRDLGFLLDQLGHYDESLMVHQLLAALCRRKAGNQDASAVDVANKALANMWLSYSLYRVGRWDEALASSEVATTMFREMAHREPKRYNPSLAKSLHFLAICKAKRGEAGEALDLTSHSSGSGHSQGHTAGQTANIHRRIGECSSQLLESAQRSREAQGGSQGESRSPGAT
ncbi:hypothetical protein A4X09_0g7313 [Tilletia walkeri]|uniref:Uncharacterized protein n=1 Tax=Tilletia walkeri TaxID=117179 RepID=A0A8X7N3H2_9BASI|nr:hypothetical protein A4X09_0g7313 [Tilletia walkeri]